MTRVEYDVNPRGTQLSILYGWYQNWSTSYSKDGYVRVEWQ